MNKSARRADETLTTIAFGDSVGGGMSALHTVGHRSIINWLINEHYPKIILVKLYCKDSFDCHD